MPGIRGRKPDLAKQREAARLRSQGYTIRGIAHRLGITRQAVEQRLAKHRARRQPLTVDRILELADRWHRRTGQWPKRTSGVIPGTHGDTWRGCRGLPSGSTPARLLAEHRSVRNRKALTRRTEEQICRWAKAHFERTGRWPGHSGAVLDVPGGAVGGPASRPAGPITLEAGKTRPGPAPRSPGRMSSPPRACRHK
jgi:transcriptional regulator with XRE-family HTH domain